MKMDDSFSCSQCNFTAPLESDLLHHQHRHHAALANFATKLDKMARMQQQLSSAVDMAFGQKENKGICRTSSATRLFGKLRAKICRSRQQLFSHPEESSAQNIKDMTAASECTSKAMKMDGARSSIINCGPDSKESYGCHLCNFSADRITVLDRHLLNDHKIDLDNLLKLVLEKTKDSLNEDEPTSIFGIRKPYYKPVDEIIEAGEFVVETISPKIKILRHASTNTDPVEHLTMLDFRNNYGMITKELEHLSTDKSESNEMIDKMKTLNACICKLVDSSNTVNKVLNKELESKRNVKKFNYSNDALNFHLKLGDQESPRDWERPHSEKPERNRIQNGHRCRSDKARSSADSHYF